ncbi:MAG: hypothetical protein J0I07_15405, partial [Myxococcales bacterium]|nr:hypothetical protein [Myxococcales bacterium]
PADPTPNGGQTPPDDTTQPATPESSDYPDEGGEGSLHDGEPAEGEAVGPRSSKSSSRRSRSLDEIPSSGCSAAPSGANTGTVVAPLALVLAACFVRRRRSA